MSYIYNLMMFELYCYIYWYIALQTSDVMSI